MLILGQDLRQPVNAIKLADPRIDRIRRHIVDRAVREEDVERAIVPRRTLCRPISSSTDAHQVGDEQFVLYGEDFLGVADCAKLLSGIIDAIACWAGA